MREIKINGKTRKLKASVGAVRFILAKYNFKEIEIEDNPEIMLDFAIESIWKFLTGIKPWLFYSIFKRKIDMDDVRAAQDIIFPMLYGVEITEDKETGNDLKAVK